MFRPPAEHDVDQDEGAEIDPVAPGVERQSKGEEKQDRAEQLAYGAERTPHCGGAHARLRRAALLEEHEGEAADEDERRERQDRPTAANLRMSPVPDAFCLVTSPIMGTNKPSETKAEETGVRAGPR